MRRRRRRMCRRWRRRLASPTRYDDPAERDATPIPGAIESAGTKHVSPRSEALRVATGAPVESATVEAAPITEP